MIITARTVLTTCVLNSIIILLLCPILKWSRIIRLWGAEVPIIILEACIIRMFVPFEFWFTYSIYLDKYWTDVLDVVCFKIKIGNRFIVQNWQVICGIWIIGAVYLIITRYWNYYRESKIINLLEEISANDLRKSMDNVEKYSELEYIKVVRHPYCDGPYLKGIFKPVIVLSDKKWSKKELDYVLLHEILHYRNKDILLKIVVDILCTIFWWNPVFDYLKKKIFHLIEIRNDLRITSNMSNEEKIAYLDCLVSVATSIGTKHQPFSISFSKSNKKNLKERLEIIAAGQQRKNKSRVVFLILMLCLIFSTIWVVIEPVYPDPTSLGISLDESNTYLIQNGDVYDVYVKIDDSWQYFFSDSDRENFSDKVMVYEKSGR